MKITIFSLFVLLLLFSCKNETNETITNASDYNEYLATANGNSIKLAIEQHEFWQKRMSADSSGVGDLGPLSRSYSMLFEATGNVDYLKQAEAAEKRAISIAADKDGYKRSLAHIFISQHRFKEAKAILEDVYAGPTNKNATERMLFDVYMELGEYEKADEMLGKIKDNSDFNYLIRLAKWSDHLGDLDSAIKYLEQAKGYAEESKNKDLLLWIYSNIGDFYGHAGRLKDSYNSYLATLALQPDNAYVKKQLAWLTYSQEKNTNEAMRILDSIMLVRKVPDYHLMKADMYAFEGNDEMKAHELDTFVSMVNTNPNYGNMYNTYLINVYSETDKKAALALAEKEITNRATPETYQLLAYSQLVNGNKEDALKTIKAHVEGKTSEPKALFHAALVYKANGLNDKVKELKKELEEASYELGPVTAQKINNL